MSLAGNSIQDRLTKRHKLMDMARVGTNVVLYSSANGTVAARLKGRCLSCSLIKLTLYLKSNLMNKET
jgi:Fe-S cluster biogenesis protein NfuA